MMNATGRVSIEARWKGHGNERGHWRIICGACTAVLGYVRPQSWPWHAEEFPVTECPREVEAYPLPFRSTATHVYSDDNYEYHLDRNGYFHIRRPARFGKHGQPVPSRGGRRRRPFETDLYYERMSRVLGRVTDGVASELEREMFEHLMEGDINTYPSHAVIVLGSPATSLPFQVYCPREKGDRSHGACGKLNDVSLPAFATLARLRRNGEWLAVLRDNDPLLNRADLSPTS